MSIVLVTGCAGFIGYHLSQRLLDLGNMVVGLDILNDYYDKSLKLDRLALLEKHNNFLFYQKDICDFKSLDNLFETYRPDKVIHLAAQAGVRYSLLNPFAYKDSNLEGFFNVLEVAKNHFTPMIYASSSSVYGDNLEKNKFFESINTDKPISLYAATKKANEVIAHSYAHLYKLPLIGLRFFTVYGPWGRPDMAIFKFTKKILKEETIDVYNKGEMYRDFTYIDDIVNGIMSTFDLKQDLSTPHDIFNLGCGNPVKLAYFVECIEKSCNKKAKINYLPLQDGDVLRTSADITLAEEKLSFKPKVQIEEGVDKFVSWYKKYYNL